MLLIKNSETTYFLHDLIHNQQKVRLEKMKLRLAESGQFPCFHRRTFLQLNNPETLKMIEFTWPTIHKRIWEIGHYQEAFAKNNGLGRCTRRWALYNRFHRAWHNIIEKVF